MSHDLPEVYGFRSKTAKWHCYRTTMESCVARSNRSDSKGVVPNQTDEELEGEFQWFEPAMFNATGQRKKKCISGFEFGLFGSIKFTTQQTILLISIWKSMKPGREKIGLFSFKILLQLKILDASKPSTATSDKSSRCNRRTRANDPRPWRWKIKSPTTLGADKCSCSKKRAEAARISPRSVPPTTVRHTFRNSKLCSTHAHVPQTGFDWKNISVAFLAM